MLQNYHFHKKYGSDILRVWPAQFLPDKVKTWLKINQAPKYYSVKYLFYFDSINDYGEQLDQQLANIYTPQVLGLSLEFLLINTSAKYLGQRPGVIIYNINPTTLGRMMERFQTSATVFQQDVVYIPTSTIEDAYRVLNKIPQGFADALLVHSSALIATNHPDQGSEDLTAKHVTIKTK